MNRFFTLLLLLASGLLLSSFGAQAQRPHRTDAAGVPLPDTTFCFAHRDTCDLLLDFYAAAPGKGPCADSLRKPLVIHVFGGAFMIGERNQPRDRAWYRDLADQGYCVAAIDYRLGLKGMDAKPGMAAVALLAKAVDMAVEDLFSATNFLIDNATELRIDCDRFVVSGSSAGAITALQAEWEIANGRALASVLPGWFNYAGIMAFSGGVLSMDGPIAYSRRPCPIMMLHGTADRIVPPGRLSLPGKQFAGSFALVKKLEECGANYQIWRYSGAGHDIAASMHRNLPEELRFMEENVIGGLHRQLDATLTDPAIPSTPLGMSSLSEATGFIAPGAP